jgi:actin related protein 2/3 complex subunit 2
MHLLLPLKVHSQPKWLSRNQLRSSKEPIRQPQQANTELAAIHYREEEAIYISPQADRVTVIFSTVFREEVDHIFGEVFLREFVDARKRPALQNAPQVLFSNRDPPLEIRGMPEVAKARGNTKGEIGYITLGSLPFWPINVSFVSDTF